MSSLRTALFASLAALTWPAAAEPVSSETQVTAQPDLLDAEYSQLRGKITWADGSGRLWVADVDRVTGLFVPADGKGLLVDAEAMSSDDLDVIGNGPEWVSTLRTEQIVYTKFLPGAPHTQANARLAFAFDDGNGIWSYRWLAANTKRNAPYGSSDAGDPLPRISYVDPQGNHYWRNLYDGTSETLVAAYPKSYRSMRFVAGARAVVFVAPVDGVSQVFRYWLDGGELEQLTFDEGDKDLHSVPWMWQAPEFGNEFVLSTLVNDVELRIYRQGAPGVAWSPIYRVTSPDGGVLNSPEPLVYQGKSYVFFAATLPPYGFPATLFLSNIDSSQPLFQRLTPVAPLRMRHDPEVFVTNDGPYIYFNRFNPAVDPSGPPNCAACSEGVWRTPTGLPAPALAPPN